MLTNKTSKSKRQKIVLALVFLAIALGTGGWFWREKQRMDELVGAGLRLINYTDQDVYTSVHYNAFPEPGDGARSETGPQSGGGGLDCCVPIPSVWRPGIKMVVKYRFGNWPKGKEETKVVDLPEYPDGRPSDLYLVFHSESDFELFSTFYAPGHPRWPGRRIEETIPEIK